MGDNDFYAFDALFGEIGWQLEPGQLRLSGVQVPTVELFNTSGIEALPHIPIGTRNRNHLTMTVDGRSLELRPGKGRLSRRSYRIDVVTNRSPLLFTPSSPTAARLVRGTRYRGDNELGVFERSLDGQVEAAWSGDTSAFGFTAKGLEPSANEAAIGYALAAGFGTGAKFVVGSIVEMIENLLP